MKCMFQLPFGLPGYSWLCAVDEDWVSNLSERYCCLPGFKLALERRGGVVEQHGLRGSGMVNPVGCQLRNEWGVEVLVDSGILGVWMEGLRWLLTRSDVVLKNGRVAIITRGRYAGKKVCRSHCVWKTWKAHSYLGRHRQRLGHTPTM
jgi:hypothetical protein